MSQCPCGSNKEFKECCEPYILGTKNAPSAVATMRARYSSFATGSIDYITNTHNPDERDQLSHDETKAWSENSEWKSLEILESEHQDDTHASVEFVATYITKNNEQTHHEVAQFEKIDDFWYFMDGEIVRNSVKRIGPKIGRNDPCVCGSGKKYKKCCL